MATAGTEHEVLISPASVGADALFAFPPVSLNGRFSEHAREPGIGRVLDVTLAIVMLILLLPLLLLLGLMVFLFDPGPVIFGHTRIGKGGQTFSCYKFRTMYVGSEERLGALLASRPDLRAQWALTQKLPKDPRVTRIGLLLRVTSLDELPQLINVIRGDMSLVGPRPIVRNEVARYGRHFAEYCSVRPGLTGLWQVTRADSTSYRRRVAADVLYVRSKSLRRDIRLLFATIPAVLIGRGLC